MMANSPRLNQDRPAQKIKQASAAQQDRQQRLSKALRENLLKRKQQIRARQQKRITPKERSAVQTKGIKD